MKILLISDIHDNIKNLVRVMTYIKSMKISHVFFCGDMVSPFTALTLKDYLDSRTFIGVWGNNDGDRDTIVIRLGEERIKGVMTIYELAGKRILILHGMNSIEFTEEIIKSLLKSKDYDFIFYGHTHIAKLILYNKSGGAFREINVNQALRSNEHVSYNIDLSKDIVAVNPGELCGYITNIPSFAIMNIQGSKALIDYVQVDSVK